MNHRSAKPEAMPTNEAESLSRQLGIKSSASAFTAGSTARSASRSTLSTERSSPPSLGRSSRKRESMPDSTDALALPAEPEVWTPPPWPKNCPPPGRYDVTYEEYAGWDAINASALKYGAELSPKHMRAGIADGRDTRARKFGRAIHCRLLEGVKVFAERFPVATGCCQPLKSGKRKGDECGAQSRFSAIQHGYTSWFCGTHAPEGADEPTDYVSEYGAGQIEDMVKAIYAHQSVKLIRAHGGCEVSIVWEREGLACKARVDKLILDANCPDTVLDLKKCQAFHIAQRELEQSIEKYYWDLQAYWYTEAAKSVRGESSKPLSFIWLFAEDDEPYDVCPLIASDAWIETGRCRAERALRLYRDAIMSGKWIGVADDVVESFPPKWHANRYGVN